jgi:hypothetical protein
MNRIPVCSDIPDVFLNEDENATINLLDYCIDEDEDSLEFSIVNSSNSDIHYNIENGLVEISSDKDFSGEGLVKFKVSDGINELETDEISVEIYPINDAPVFEGTIPNTSFNQNTDLVDGIDLNGFFSDADSNLSFDFTGNHLINIEINNGKVSFYPESGFVGSETVVFSAGDEEFTMYSNPVVVQVKDVNEPPQFKNFNCTTGIKEDVENTCELNCSINGNVLRYISNKDYTGRASCLIRVTDNLGSYSEKNFEVNIDNINDEPVIKDYSPNGNPKLVAGVDTRFNLLASDVDSAVNIFWKIDNVSVGSGTTYLFNKPEGVYNLVATASDGEYSVSHSWSVNVGNINEFSCSEVSGHVCSVNQTCSGIRLGVYDTDSCCSVACSAKPLEFSSIRKVDYNKTGDIKININKPLSSDKVYLNEKINASVEVENSMSEDLDLEVQAYVYDITKNRVIDKLEQTDTLDKNDIKDFEFGFELSEELKEKDKYYLFVRVIGKDSNKKRYYNEKYSELSLNRKDSDIILKELSIDNENLICGDQANVTFTIENLGQVYQYITADVKNTELKIDVKTESFRVGEYGDDDTIKSITITIPDDAKEGNYTLIGNVILTDKTLTLEKEIILGKCKNERSIKTSLETIKINPDTNQAISSTKESENRKRIFIIISLMTLTMMIVMLALLIVYKRKEEADY